MKKTNKKPSIGNTGKTGAYLSCREKFAAPCIRKHTGQFSPLQSCPVWRAAKFSEERIMKTKQQQRSEIIQTCRFMS
jgi:hypothetical protein